MCTMVRGGVLRNTPTARGERPESFRPGALRSHGGGTYCAFMTSRAAAQATTWTLFADGAARGNPGPAAAGFVLDDPAGAERLARGIALGTATNNVAEYKALVEGLSAALALGVEEIAVRMDSELVVRQMTGCYRVKNEGLKPLFKEAQALSSRFRSFAVEHVRREMNSRADAAANRALDGED